MATLWEKLSKALGNAGSAAQNVNNQAIQTAQNKAPTAEKVVATPVTTTPATNNTTTKGYYETAAEQLNMPYQTGTTPTINQIIQNNKNSTSDEKNVNNNAGAGNDSGSGAGTNAVYNAYARAQAQRNQDYLNQIGSMYDNAIASTNKQKETGLATLDSQLAKALELLEEQLNTSKTDALNTKNEIVAMLENQYGLSKEQAKKQLDDAVARAAQQQELMKQQRDTQLKNTKESNERAAETSLRDAYVNYMMNANNLAQILKGAGISGGASESSVVGMNNNYQNNRNSINLQRNEADRQAQYTYDTGINEDAMNYNNQVNSYNDAYYNALTSAKNIYDSGILGATSDYNTAVADANTLYNTGKINANDSYSTNKYNLENSIAQALIDLGLARDTAVANAKQSARNDYAALMKEYRNALEKSSKSTSSAVTSATSAGTTASGNNTSGSFDGYSVMQVQLGNNTYTVPQLINTLAAQGMDDAQIEAFLNAKGIK